MFADDTNVAIKAEMRYVTKIKEILDTFAAASGLRSIWEKTKAAYIPGGPHLGNLGRFPGPGK